ELLCYTLQSTDAYRNFMVVLGLEEVGCLRCLGAPYPWSPHVPYPPQVVHREDFA
nr:hypothetical protein [Tanacetum cinerariifolium]